MARRESHSFVLFIIIIGHILASRDIPRYRYGCPDYCRCKIKPLLLFISDCSKDPGDDLDDIIQDNRNITTLGIYKSHLSTLPTAVCKLSTLIYLCLDMNELLDLPWACLHKIHTLGAIDVQHNKFSVLRNGVLYGFKNLEYLGMSENHVSEIEEDVFTDVSRLPSLTYVDLAHNYIESVDPWALMFLERPTTMLFNNNRISRFTNRPGWVYNCSMPRPGGVMPLRGNNISHIMDIYLGWNLTEASALCLFTNSSFVLDIRDNNLNCVCRDFSIYRTLVKPTNKLTNKLRCASPPKLYGRIIANIDLSEFVCHVHDGCPHGCDCIDTWMNMTVRCPKNGLETLPNGLPSAKTKLSVLSVPSAE